MEGAEPLRPATPVLAMLVLPLLLPALALPRRPPVRSKVLLRCTPSSTWAAADAERPSMLLLRSRLFFRPRATGAEEGEDVGGAAAMNDRGSASGSSPSTLFLSRVEAMMGSRKTRAFGAVEKRSLRTC